MLRRLIATTVLAVSALAVAAAPAAAEPAYGYKQSALVLAASPASAPATASCYRRSGNHWNCITPGAYCPAAAHGRYGYAKITHRKYRCSQYDNGQWRWKRA